MMQRPLEKETCVDSLALAFPEQWRSGRDQEMCIRKQTEPAEGGKQVIRGGGVKKSKSWSCKGACQCKLKRPREINHKSSNLGFWQHLGMAATYQPLAQSRKGDSLPYHHLVGSDSSITRMCPAPSHSPSHGVYKSGSCDVLILRAFADFISLFSSPCRQAPVLHARLPQL